MSIHVVIFKPRQKNQLFPCTVASNRQASEQAIGCQPITVQQSWLLLYAEVNLVDWTCMAGSEKKREHIVDVLFSQYLLYLFCAILTVSVFLLPNATTYVLTASEKPFLCPKQEFIQHSFQSLPLFLAFILCQLEFVEFLFACDAHCWFRGVPLLKFRRCLLQCSWHWIFILYQIFF